MYQLLIFEDDENIINCSLNQFFHYNKITCCRNLWWRGSKLPIIYIFKLNYVPFWTCLSLALAQCMDSLFFLSNLFSNIFNLINKIWCYLCFLLLIFDQVNEYELNVYIMSNALHAWLIMHVNFRICLWWSFVVCLHFSLTHFSW